MRQVHKLAIYLNGSEYIDGEFKLKVYDFDVEKDTPKTITLVDKNRKIRKNKAEFNKVQTDFKNNSFMSITYYAYCETDDIENITKDLIKAIKAQFKRNEDIYKSAKKALKEPMKSIHVV